MDVNILIICITVIICAALAAGTVAFATEHGHKRWEAAIAFAAALVAQASEGVKGDE